LFAPHALAVDAGGRLYVAGWDITATNLVGRIFALTPAGEIDRSFGTAGSVPVGIAGRQVKLNRLALTSDGLAVEGTAAMADGSFDEVLARFERSGQPVSGFGSGGQVLFHDPPMRTAGGLAFAAGRLLLAVNRRVADRDVPSVVGFDATGAVDAAFGGPSGEVLEPSDPITDATASVMTLAGDGSIIVAGTGAIRRTSIGYWPPRSPLSSGSPRKALPQRPCTRCRRALRTSARQGWRR